MPLRYTNLVYSPKDMPSIEDIQSETAENQDYVREALDNPGETHLIYVNGAIYKGPYTYGCMRGFGWHGGLWYALELPDVDPSSSVSVAFLSFGRLRHFRYEESDQKGNHGHPMCWRMETLPEDEA
jgi:hypothetical protein